MHFCNRNLISLWFWNEPQVFLLFFLNKGQIICLGYNEKTNFNCWCVVFHLTSPIPLVQRSRRRRQSQRWTDPSVFGGNALLPLALWGPESWNSFIWNGASIQASHQESLCRVWSAVWQKEAAVWQRQRPAWQRTPWHLDPVCWALTQTGQTVPSGISALWFPLPWPTLIVIPHYFAKGGGMNHKLLRRNDISCSETTPPLPLVVTDKGNKFLGRLEFKRPSSEWDHEDLAQVLWSLLAIPK